MPCMGPTKDDKIAALVVEELKKVESFDWEHMPAVYALERAATDALKAQWGEAPKGWHRVRQIVCLCWGLLYPRQPGEIDWGRFQAELDEAIWAFDAADF